MSQVMASGQTGFSEKDYMNTGWFSYNSVIKDVYRHVLQLYSNPERPANRRDILYMQCWSTALLDRRLNNPPLLTGTNAAKQVGCRGHT